MKPRKLKPAVDLDAQAYRDGHTKLGSAGAYPAGLEMANVYGLDEKQDVSPEDETSWIDELTDTDNPVRFPDGKRLK